MATAEVSEAEKVYILHGIRVSSPNALIPFTLLHLDRDRWLFFKAVLVRCGSAR